MIGQWQAQAAYRDKLGLAYAHVFSAEWGNVQCDWGNGFGVGLRSTDREYCAIPIMYVTVECRPYLLYTSTYPC